MMTKIFIDTDVLLDLLLERSPFFESIAKIITLAIENKVKLYTSSLSIVNSNYILSKYKNAENSKSILNSFLIYLELVKLDEELIIKGLNSDFKDFEDSLQHFSALDSKCEYLLTRNIRDFKKSKIPVFTPDEFISIYLNKS
ncbi:MAG: PIN domain-containing protein [Ignavibacteria bacterium]|nr:PIN domain-containing protein [Ignavibacteria bacterium]